MKAPNKDLLKSHWIYMPLENKSHLLIPCRVRGCATSKNKTIAPNSAVPQVPPTQPTPRPTGRLRRLQTLTSSSSGGSCPKCFILDFLRNRENTQKKTFPGRKQRNGILSKTRPDDTF